MNKKKEQWGGARPGAGRKKGKPTKTLSYRVAADHADKIDSAIRKVITTISKS